MDIWTRFHKMNLHQRINKANLITQFFKTNSSKLHFKSFKISREQYRKIVNAIPKPFAIFIIFFHDEISKKLIGKKKNNSWRWKNSKKQEGKKGAYPVKNHDSKVSFFFYFLFLKEHASAVGTGLIQIGFKVSSLTRFIPRWPLSRPRSRSRAHTLRGSHVIDVSSPHLIFVSCSVPEFNRASFCKHTN